MGKDAQRRRTRARQTAALVVLAASTGLALDTPPVRWSRTANVAWTATLPGAGDSTPVLAGDRLFVTAEPFWLSCVRKSDGQVLWQRANAETNVLPPDAKNEYLDRCRRRSDLTVRWLEAQREKLGVDRRLMDDPTNPELRGRSAALKSEVARLERESQAGPTFRRQSVRAETGMAACSPATDGRTVVAVFGNGVVAAYDADGDLKWARYLGPVTFAQGQTMAPAVAGGVAGLHFEQEFLSLDLATGRTLWRRDHARDAGGRTEGAPSGSPAAARAGGSDLFVTTGAGLLRAADGSPIGKLPRLLWHSPAAYGDAVWCLPEDSTLEGVRLAATAEGVSLNRLASVPLRAEGDKRKLEFRATPLVREGFAYLLTSDGALIVVDTAAGRVVHERGLGMGEGYAAPVGAGRFVFVTGASGTCVALERRWKKTQIKPGEFRREPVFNEVARNTLEPTRATPVFEGDRLFMRCGATLYGVAASAADKTLGQPLDEKADDMLQDLERTTHQRGPAVGLE